MVECTSLDLAILSLRLALTTLLGCVTRFSALQVLYLKTTLLGVKLLPETSSSTTSSWAIYCVHFVNTFLKGSRMNYLSRIGSSVIQEKEIQIKWRLVKAWVRFIEESCIYLFTISYLATTELRPQFRRTTALFITN